MSQLDKWIKELHPEECPFVTKFPHEWNEKSILMEVKIGDTTIWKREDAKIKSS